MNQERNGRTTTTSSKNGSGFNWGYFGLGVGIGAGAGGLATYFLTKRKIMRRARRSLKKAFEDGAEKGYEEGYRDCREEDQKWINENVVILEGETSDEVVKELHDKMDILKEASEKVLNGSESSSDGERENIHEQSETGLRNDSGAICEGSGDENTVMRENVVDYISASKEYGVDGGSQNGLISRLKASLSRFDYGRGNIRLDGEEGVTELSEGNDGHTIVITWRGRVIAEYPIEAFVNRNGEALSEMAIRQNIKAFEKDVDVLRQVYSAMGWGSYEEGDNSYLFRGANTVDPDDPHAFLGLGANDSDIDDEDEPDWDCEIDDEEASENARIHSEQRERWLNDVEKYNNGEDKAVIISQKDYDEECHLEQVTVDYYDDNIFVDNRDFDRPIDPVENFGIASWDELEKMAEESGIVREDPDIICVKNFRLNSVFEITRMNQIYRDTEQLY